MKKIISLLTLAFIFSMFIPAESNAQAVMGLPYDEIHAKNDIAMPYQYVREADVMWSKIVWRKVELREKRNHILYEPTEPIGDKKSLIDVVLDAVQKQGLTAYKAASSDAGYEFDNVAKEEDIDLGGGKKTEVIYNPNTGGYDTTYIEEPVKTYQVEAYVVKELWFFDKQRSVLDVRVIGFAPVRKYESNGRPVQTKLFWVYYPEVRPFLAKSPVYSDRTDANPLTYDDIFQKRYFSSFIIQESNPYNRSIEDYELGLEALLEGERVKEKIFNFEQDLWEY